MRAISTFSDRPQSGASPLLPLCVSVALCLPLLATPAVGADPLQLHPRNPHYFLLAGKPTVLITSADHYGSVLNLDYDYHKYLATLGAHGFNLTRTFSGAYCESAGAFKIHNNVLAPRTGRLICPWARSDTPGYAGGGNKFDLTKWDDVYFKRLRDFVTEAARRGVVVEMNLWCPFYGDEMWNLSPMNAKCNVNGVGAVKRQQVYTLSDKKLTEVQDAMTAKIVTELNGFDNLYYEICNEPYFGVADAWQAHMSQVIVDTEKALPKRHLISQNIANGTKKVDKPDPNVSIFNFHYTHPPVAVEQNFALNKPLGENETGFRGSDDKPYRTEAWDIIIAGGALFNNLDYSFIAGREDGTAPINAPGGGGVVFRKQLEVLKDFINSFDFIAMKPDNAVIKAGPTGKTSARALVQRGKAYAIYVNGDGVKSLTLDLPAGDYRVQWINTKTGKVDKSDAFTHAGGDRVLDAPAYRDDVAFRVVRQSGK